MTILVDLVRLAIANWRLRRAERRYGDDPGVFAAHLHARIDRLRRVR